MHRPAVQHAVACDQERKGGLIRRIIRAQRKGAILKLTNRKGRGRPRKEPEIESLLPSTKDCMRTSGVGRTCDRCGAKPHRAHVPLKRPGVFCESCCPICTAAARLDGGLALEERAGFVARQEAWW